MYIESIGHEISAKAQGHSQRGVRGGISPPPGIWGFIKENRKRKSITTYLPPGFENLTTAQRGLLREQDVNTVITYAYISSKLCKDSESNTVMCKS